jgi:hypothetical protein
MRLRIGVVLALAAAACGEEGIPAPEPIHLGDHLTPYGEAEVWSYFRVDGETSLAIHLDGNPLVIEVWVDSIGAVEATIDGETSSSSTITWFRPRPIVDETVEVVLTGQGNGKVVVWARGAPVPPIERGTGLVWTDPGIVDEPAVIGLGRVLAAASPDGHGGVLLDRWLRRFATTTHSERAAPAQLMDEIAAQQGADPSLWDLDALPFKVTGVHNRLDLGPREGECGQLRVSFASTHPVYAPFHMIFLFRQPARLDDIAPDGTVHCHGTARRWARLGLVDAPEVPNPWAVADLLDSALRWDLFLMAETVELTVSPWEWRQWLPVEGDPDTLDNPRLFQTIDLAAANEPGPFRDELLAWIEDNAQGLAERTVEIPETFRPRSARVNPAPPFPALDLDGIDPAVLAAYPDLAAQATIVGCPTCHTTDAEFVQTSAQREFSPFYDRELDVRAARIDLMNAGRFVPVPPFGPLQVAE